jgi:hypothetical protein
VVGVILGMVGVVVGVMLLVLVIRAVARVIRALPQAIGGGAIGLIAGLLFGDALTFGLAGAGIGLLAGLAEQARSREMSSPPARAAIPPAPPPPPRAPPPEPDVARAWDQALRLAPDCRAQITASRVGCELLLELDRSGTGDAATAEWAGVIRERVPRLVDRVAAAMRHLDPAARKGEAAKLARTLEQIAGEADTRRAAVARAAQDEADTLHRYFDARTRPDPLGSGPG